MRPGVISAIVAVFFLAFPAVPYPAHAGEGAVGVDASLESSFLVPHSAIYRDDSATLGADDIISGKLPASRTDGKVASFGFSQSANWFDVTITNPAKPGAASLERYLVFGPTWIDSIDVTHIRPDGSRATMSCGDYQAFSCRAIEHRNINFRIDLPPGENRLLVRTQTSDPYVVTISLWEKAAFFGGQLFYSSYYGVLYGVLGALLLYNLIVYFMVREGVYAAYVAYLASFIAMNFTYSGHSYAHLWPDYPLWGNWAHSISIYLFVFAGLAFGSIFLGLRSKMPRAFRWAKFLGLTALLSFVASAAIGGYGLQVQTSILWVSVYAPFIMVLGIISLLAGNFEARYFVFATAAGFIGSFVTALTVLGFLPYTFPTFHAADMGMMVDAILLSIALADRLRLARRQSETARAELLKYTQSYARRLEVEVRERTEQLDKSNADKDRILAIIAHDLRGPVGSLSVMFNHTVRSAGDVTDSTLKMVRATMTNISELLEELLSWAEKRGNPASVQEGTSVARALDDTAKLLAMQASGLGINLNLEIDGDCMVRADPEMLRTILRNITSNAIKFTPENGSITAAVSKIGNSCKISITDTGAGIGDDVMKNLFSRDGYHSTPGVRGEKGTGLGLMLCRDLAEMNNGSIGCESARGQGSTFWLALPLDQSAGDDNA